MDSQKLIQWFEAEKRDLPWRQDPTPYAVWVSEVMLQQTQVAVVIPYFEKWMTLFPDIPSLAKAPLDSVIKAWEGLGYYSRARNLHAGAQYVMEHFQGQIPNTPEELGKIKGLGPYTVGAILSFAFHQKAPAVDGNVLRVLARYYMVEEEICRAKVQKELRNLTLSILPDERPWVFSEALIELGAKVCSKNPNCSICPVRAGCLAHRHGRQKELPMRKARASSIPLYREVLLIYANGSILVSKVEQGKVMAGLHEFPYIESTEDGLCRSQLHREVGSLCCCQVEQKATLQEVQHGFTRYRVTLRPFLFQAQQAHDIDGYEWVPLVFLKQLAFSAGHRKLVKQLEKVIYQT